MASPRRSSGGSKIGRSENDATIQSLSGDSSDNAGASNAAAVTGPLHLNSDTASVASLASRETGNSDESDDNKG